VIRDLPASSILWSRGDAFTIDGTIVPENIGALGTIYFALVVDELKAFDARTVSCRGLYQLNL
jgi:hypothetical protein